MAILTQRNARCTAPVAAGSGPVFGTGRPGLLRRALVLVLIAGVFPAPWTAHGLERVPEYELKAAFLYNIVRFVEWPEEVFENDEDSFRIGILGDDPFGEILDEAVENRTIDGRSIDVRRSWHLSEVLDCHLLFISVSERDHLEQIFRDIGGRPILTVADMGHFAVSGGVVELYITPEQRVAFRINASAAERADLAISSRLLNLATVVEGN